MKYNVILETKYTGNITEIINYMKKYNGIFVLEEVKTRCLLNKNHIIFQFLKWNDIHDCISNLYILKSYKVNSVYLISDTLNIFHKIRRSEYL